MPGVWLVYGSTGWIGGQLVDMLKKAGENVQVGKVRLQNRESLEKEIDEIKPTYVLNAAGVTGRPNVDWCEDHKQETIRTNVIGTLNLADVCNERGIQCTVYATGCIYEYDDAHPIGGKTFTEEDAPNFEGSFYSKTKIYVEKLLKFFPTTLILRVRMPISDDLNGRSFVTKISKYAKVVNVPNSMTILTDLLPVSIDLTKKQRRGVYNFTNPGAISHNEILTLYKEYIDPNFTWVNFSLEEQAKILKAGRSNNELDSSKLLKEYPEIKPVKEAMVEVFKRMKVNLGK
jgi:dTDP-4-dehydrorhamnose reductase